jgi:hypothetical protein
MVKFVFPILSLRVCVKCSSQQFELHSSSSYPCGLCVYIQVFMVYFYVLGASLLFPTFTHPAKADREEWFLWNSSLCASFLIMLYGSQVCC